MQSLQTRFRDCSSSPHIKRSLSRTEKYYMIAWWHLVVYNTNILHESSDKKVVGGGGEDKLKFSKFYNAVFIISYVSNDTFNL